MTKKDRNDQNFCGLIPKDASAEKKFYNKALYNLSINKAKMEIEPIVSRPILRAIPQAHLEKMSSLDTSFTSDLNQSLELQGTPLKSSEQIEYETNQILKEQALL